MKSIFHIKNRIFYGWVVVAAVVVSGFIMIGVNSSFGVFFKSLEGTFGLTRATTSAVLSGRMAFSCLSAVLGGWAIDRCGPKVVFSIMGLFIGISLILTKPDCRRLAAIRNVQPVTGYRGWGILCGNNVNNPAVV